MDELSQLEDEFNHDDSTSCTSSLATSLSMNEDTDDLHLGAEANSFDLGLTSKEESEQKDQFLTTTNTSSQDSIYQRQYINNQYMIMKERYSPFELSDNAKTFASVSNVSDLLNARECDAGEMLASLGFISTSDCYNKRDILSRFQPSSTQNNEDRKFLRRAASITPSDDFGKTTNALDRNESFSKTNEWLAMYHGEQTDNSLNHADKNKQSAVSDQSAVASVKKPVLQGVNKLRRRLSKSRQPSFELLLTKVKEEKEEEANAENENQVKLETNQTDITTYSPIRESSMERANSGAQTPPENIDGKNQVGELSAIRPSKTSLLLSTQLESFEMEEIISCNGEGAESQKQRRSGVYSMPSDNLKRLPSADHNLTGNTSHDDENDSSSGFDEDDTENISSMANMESSSDEEKTRKIKPHTVVESMQVNFSRGKQTSRSSNTVRYIYDVPLGELSQPEEESKSENVLVANCNNNKNTNHSDKHDFLAMRSHSFSTLPNGFIPLRCGSSSQGSRKSLNSRTIVTPLPEEPLNKDPVEIGKCRRLMADARRRRMEFASRCAVSGDSIGEIYTSTSLQKQNGSFVVRKRRPGCFHYYGSTDSLRERTQLRTECSNRAVQKSNGEDSPTRTRNNLIDRLARSLSANHISCNSLTTPTSNIQNLESHVSLSSASAPPNEVPAYYSNSITSYTTHANNDTTHVPSAFNGNNNSNYDVKVEQSRLRKQLVRQRSVSSADDVMPAQPLHLTNTYCGQCYG